MSIQRPTSLSAAGGDRPPKRALGRGLSALIPQAAKEAGTEPTTRSVRNIPVEAISRDGTQPRKRFDEARLAELAESIRAQGVLQPILVRGDGDGYRLIAGERRWRAAQLAGLQDIPALIREASDAEAFELALVENLQRADLNPIEEAEGYRRLIEEFSLTQEQVSQRVGKDRSTVTNALRLLGLPEEVKGLVSAGALNMGHARALLGVPHVPELVQLAEKIAAQRLSVRETERMVKQSRSAPAAREGGGVSPERRALVDELQRLLGTKVRISDRAGKGSIEIDFQSYEDLDRILARIRK